MRDFKVGDWIIYIDKDYSDYWKRRRGISLYGKIAKIIAVNNWVNYNSYLIEFQENIKFIIMYGKSKKDYCIWGKKKNLD